MIGLGEMSGHKPQTKPDQHAGRRATPSRDQFIGAVSDQRGTASECEQEENAETGRISVIVEGHEKIEQQGASDDRQQRAIETPQSQDAHQTDEHTQQRPFLEPDLHEPLRIAHHGGPRKIKEGGPIVCGRQIVPKSRGCRDFGPVETRPPSIAQR